MATLAKSRKGGVIFIIVIAIILILLIYVGVSFIKDTVIPTAKKGLEAYHDTVTLNLTPANQVYTIEFYPSGHEQVGQNLYTIRIKKIRDAYGKAITALKPHNFEIYEDDNLREVVSVASSYGFSGAILIEDNNNILTLAEQALAFLKGRLNDERKRAYMAIYTYGTEGELELNTGFTSDESKLKKPSLSTSRRMDEMYLYDALASMLIALNERVRVSDTNAIFLITSSEEAVCKYTNFLDENGNQNIKAARDAIKDLLAHSSTKPYLFILSEEKCDKCKLDELVKSAAGGICTTDSNTFGEAIGAVFDKFHEMDVTYKKLEDSGKHTITVKAIYDGYFGKEALEVDYG